MTGSVKAASAPGSLNDGGRTAGSPGRIRPSQTAQSAAHTASSAAAEESSDPSCPAVEHSVGAPGAPKPTWSGIRSSTICSTLSGGP
eukprot:1534466-Prymnesium_polylepis.1